MDHKHILSYSERGKIWSLAGALSPAIGLTTCAVVIVVFGSLESYDSFILILAFDYHLVLLLPCLSAMGIVLGILGYRSNLTRLAIIGVALSGLALIGSLATCALDYVLFYGGHHNGYWR